MVEKLSRKASEQYMKIYAELLRQCRVTPLDIQAQLLRLTANPKRMSPEQLVNILGTVLQMKFSVSLNNQYAGTIKI